MDPKNDTGHPVATPPEAHTMGHYFQELPDLHAEPSR